MTSEDDPFGRSDRTIIRPNPAGRRRRLRLRGVPPPARLPGGAAAGLDAARPPVALSGPARRAPPAAPPARGPGAARAADDWMTPRAPNNLYVAPDAPRR